MFDILWICLTYCIGSVPFGLVFAKTSAVSTPARPEAATWERPT